MRPWPIREPGIREGIGDATRAHSPKARRPGRRFRPREPIRLQAESRATHAGEEDRTLLRRGPSLLPSLAPRRESARQRLHCSTSRRTERVGLTCTRVIQESPRSPGACRRRSRSARHDSGRYCRARTQTAEVVSTHRLAITEGLTENRHPSRNGRIVIPGFVES